ncbi:MAG TPA: choice-of-anchor tandem repeat GloVer-containing protein [Terriglobales bacterium]|jgi:uncharacterized repeat protein (TIGR03803 family)
MEGRMGSFKGNALRIFAVIALLVCAAWAAPTTQVIYSFAGDEDGEYTDTDLILDSAGNIYGTSVLGGEFGTGSVFQLSPSGNTWVHTVLYSFTGQADGGQPYKGVTMDAAGNLYGSAVIGGKFGACPEDGCGVVYKLTNNGGSWTQTVIHAFNGNDGYGPGQGLTFDTAGNLYGMTATGGQYGLGVIYQLRPQQDGTWKLRVIHHFTGGNDGSSGSAGRLLLDASGSLFGVATTGGANGKGTAFRLTPTQNDRWNFTTLYAFQGQPDAGFPYGALVGDPAGNLYGTTYWDGANNLGSVYQLSPGPGGKWRERVLYSFKGGRDGNSSISNLVIDKRGRLYGTTSEGGAGCSCGVIFRVAKDANGVWKETIAYRFQGAPDAGFAYNGMVADSSGNMFGATVHGGDDDEGSIYKFVP